METSLFLVALALFLHGFAFYEGFFRLGDEVPRRGSVDFTTVCIVFALYVGSAFVIIPSALSMIYGSALGSALASIKGMYVPQIISVSIQLGILALLIIYLGSRRTEILFGKSPTLQSVTQDVTIGVLLLILAFPLVMILIGFAEMLIQHFSPGVLPDQEAIRIMKQSLSYLPSFITMTVSAVLVAPLIEEFVFRGILQSFLRNYLGPIGSILISSFIFALFHFSTRQGLGNISLIITLFFLALYLGFAYEKQRSLVASFTLHMLFNGINIVRLFISEV